jgi:radical SAM superfamily enzyme YgiQ (UPF0313 family)
MNVSNETTPHTWQAVTPDRKILLVLLPFWSPFIPPMGIACLKSYLAPRGFNVKALDANVEAKSRQYYDRYFDTLQGYIPQEKQGNFFNLGFGIWQDHMMAHFNSSSTADPAYLELVKTLVYHTYYTRIETHQAKELSSIIKDHYTWLESYVTGLLDRERPAVLGLSVYNSTLPASLFTFKLVRERYPGIRTVMGGGVFADMLAEGSPDLDYFLEQTENYIDRIIVGEGEGLFLRLLRGELPKNRRVHRLQDSGNRVLDIASLDVPDFSDFDLQHYPHLASFASRSCPFQCSFCSEAFQWGRYRKKGAGQISAQLIRLYNTYDSRLFSMCDSLLNPVITSLAEEFENSDLPIYWDGFLRADPHTCDTDNTAMWRRGGFYRARMGLESGSQKMLDAMGKKISVAQMKDAVASLAYAGIKTTTYWVIGHPGETEEDFQQTLDLVEELKDDIYEADCNPFIYFPTGQANSTRWAGEHKSVLLYPPEFREMLMVQTWIMDCYPPREEVYRRLNRFVRHCRKLNIPNPYSLKEIDEADKRWKKLQKHAVPGLLELLESRDSDIVDEHRHIRKIAFAREPGPETGDWGF